MWRKDSLEQQKKQEAIVAKKIRVEEHLEDLQACYFDCCKKSESEDKKDIYYAPCCIMFIFDCCLYIGNLMSNMIDIEALGCLNLRKAWTSLQNIPILRFYLVTIVALSLRYY